MMLFFNHREANGMILPSSRLVNAFFIPMRVVAFDVALCRCHDPLYLCSYSIIVFLLFLDVVSLLFLLD